MPITRQLLLFVLFALSQGASGQNLIVNPGAELDPSTNGWTMVAGTQWQRSAQVTPRAGSYHFYAGGSLSLAMNELTQDVDVSGYSVSIDAGTATFAFSGWMRVFNFDFAQGLWNDQARILVEYINAGATVLASYDTGLRNNNTWTNYSDTRLAPVGTRTIRIHLYSNRLGIQAGKDSDGYVDDLSLTYSGPLPVNLISFTANPEARAVTLRWESASEESNAFYTLERSVDAKEWEVIHTQTGAGNSNEVQRYQFVDEGLVSGNYYYRLSQTDLDGTTARFPIISERVLGSVAQSDEFIFSPNPSEGLVTIELGTAGMKQIQDYDLQGHAMITPIVFDGIIYTADFSALPVGSYVLELQTLSSVSRQILIRK